MDAAWRNWYLGALGVVRYLPRDTVMPAAGEVETPLPRTLRAAAPAADGGTAILEGPRPALPEMAPSARPRRSSNEPAPHVAPPAAPAVDGDGERVAFRLAFWQPSSDLVVLSAMPPGNRPGRGQLEMLANLLKAIGQLPGPLPSPEFLDWPPSPAADASLGSARQMLTTYLDVKQQLKPFRWALLMGDMAARLAAPATGHAVGDRPDLACRARGVVAHSLYDMDRDKALKRDTWEALRFLVGEAG